MAIFFEVLDGFGLGLLIGVMIHGVYTAARGVESCGDRLIIVIASLGVTGCILLAGGRNIAPLCVVLLFITLCVGATVLGRWRIERSEAMRHIRSGIILALSDHLDRDESYLAGWADRLKIGQRQVGLSSVYFTLNDLATLARYIWRVGNWKVATVDGKAPHVIKARYRKLEDSTEALVIETNIISTKTHHYELRNDTLLKSGAVPDLGVKTADYLVLSRQAASSHFAEEAIAADQIRFPKGIDTEMVSCGVVADDDIDEKPAAQLLAWAFAWECASYNEALLEQGDIAQPTNLRVESGADGGLKFIVQSHEQLWVLVDFAKNICEALCIREEFQAGKARQSHIAAATASTKAADAAQA